LNRKIFKSKEFHGWKKNAREEKRMKGAGKKNLRNNGRERDEMDRKKRTVAGGTRRRERGEKG